MKKTLAYLLVVTTSFLFFAACKKEIVTSIDGNHPLASPTQIQVVSTPTTIEPQISDSNLQTQLASSPSKNAVVPIQSPVASNSTDVESKISDSNLQTQSAPNQSKANTTTSGAEKNKTVAYTAWDDTTVFKMHNSVYHCNPGTQPTINTKPFEERRHTLCQTSEQLQTFLQQNQYSSDWASAYNEDYYKNNDLLLFEAVEAYDHWFVEDLFIKDNVLHPQLTKHKVDGIESNGTIHYSIYRVEIHEKLTDVIDIRPDVV